MLTPLFIAMMTAATVSVAALSLSSIQSVRAATQVSPARARRHQLGTTGNKSTQR